MRRAIVISLWLRLWRDTGSVFGSGPFGAVRRLSLAGKAVRQSHRLTRIYQNPPLSSLAKLFADRPKMIGILVWPYQCASWQVSQRLDGLMSHCETVDRIGSPFDIRATERVVLADLEFVRDDLRVVLDNPEWFLREGSLVINLFVGRVRMYSLAFSLSSGRDGLIATIGAIQGRSVDGASEEYKLLTKKAHGMRPRDLLFEIFSMICQNLQVRRILAVSNEDRHHLHPFFSGAKKESSDYNEIWMERGGTRISHSFFELEAINRRRSEDDIPTKKRSMYKKRYEMLDEIERRLSAGLSSPRYAAAEVFDL